MCKTTSCNSTTRDHPVSKEGHAGKDVGEAFLLTVGVLLLTVKLLCLQSLKVLIRRTFPLKAKKAPTVSKKKLKL